MNGDASGGTENTGLAAERFAVALRERTRSLHTDAERSGVIADVLNGIATRRAYALFLRNLLGAYRALEQGFERQGHSPALAEMNKFEIHRAGAIEADLRALEGDDWSDELPLLGAGAAYAERVLAAASGNGAGLVGHAYVRYLGDLNGGRVLRRLLAENLGLGPNQLTFYEFPAVADLRAFAADYRMILARAAIVSGDPEAALSEAAEAFRHNIAVSSAVRRAAA